MDKTDYLAYLHDADGQLALHYFPVAYGANPYADKKLRRHDQRTPTTAAGRVSSIHRISEKDMNGMWIGITVPDPERPRRYWSRGERIGFHGTPRPRAMGAKASSG